MVTIPRVLASPVIESLGWALIHFVWQAALLAGFVAILMILLRRGSAKIRYLIQCATLLAMLVAPLMTWGWIASFDRPTEPVVSSAVAHSAEVLPGPATNDRFLNDEPVMTPVASNQFDVAEASPITPVSVDASTTPVPQLATQVVSWRDRVHDQVAPKLPWLVSVWLAGVLVLSFRLLIGWRIVQRMKRLAITHTADAIQARLTELALRLGITRTVRLVESALIEVPTVIGWIRPVILLPVSVVTSLTPQQLEAILAHELAHIRRHDYLVNLIQTAIETLLFYHPAVWWLSHLIRIEREHCCDDLAIHLCDSPVTYVSALAVMEELRISPAMTLAANGGSLLNRIRRIARGPVASARRSTWWGASLITLTLVASLGLTSYLVTQAHEGTPVVTNEPPVADHSQPEPKPEVAPNSKVRISGRAVDATTGQVIKNIRMVPTSVSRNEARHVTWQSQYLKDFPDGRFVYETDRPWDQTKLRIEADGYQPAVTRAVNKGEVVELDVKLQRGILGGVVRLPNGRPAVKAQVALATWTNEIYITQGRLSYSLHGAKLRKMIETDEQGRFTLPAEIDPSVLIAAHGQGYGEQPSAETTLARRVPVGQDSSDVPEDTAIIQLQPWGRVEGQVLLGDKPVTGAKYWVYQGRSDDVHVQSQQTVLTNAEGRFVVEQLPPGPYGTCQRAVDSSDGKSSHALGGLRVRFNVSAGQTTTLELGGRGRTLSGLLAIPEGFPHKIDWTRVHLRVSPQAPRLRLQLNVNNEPGTAWSEFMSTEEGHSYVRNILTVAANGSFQIEGLPAAEYDLRVSVPGDAAINEEKPTGEILSGSSKFSVPTVATDGSPEVIQLGTIDLRSLIPLTNVAEWGRGEATDNGLRARVVPVLSSMNEDAIDPTQRVTRFAKPEDVAFVVELENVGDKPITLLDTRYGDGYGEAKGKASSDWFGQFLFSFDLFDQAGNRIERPEVQVVSQDMMLGGALVMQLEPGATHRYLLRPGKWQGPFTLPLEGGRYRVAVHYHGLQERVAKRMREYRPDSRVLEAAACDVATAAVPIDIDGSRMGTPARPEFEEKTGKSAHPTLVWGDPSNGLRAAMAFVPQQESHSHGDKPDIRLHVQNVSDKPITLATQLWLSELNATVTNEQGKPVEVGSTWYSGMTPAVRVTLKPQQTVVFGAGNIGLAITKDRAAAFEHVTYRTLVAPTGKYSIQLAGRFGDSFLLKDGKGKVLAPLEGDYIGELKTGATPFEILSEKIDCDIVDAITGKPVVGTLVNFRFFKPKSGDAPEEIVSDMFWGPKSPSHIFFVIPDQVLQRADREEIEFHWSVSGHPDYENAVSAERITLKPFFHEGPKSAREKLSAIKLIPKMKDPNARSDGAAKAKPPEGPGSPSRVARVEENGHYQGKKAAEFIDALKPAWGETHLGIQYGVAFTSPQRQFQIGERVPLAAFVRNVSDKPLRIETSPDFHGNTPTVLDAQGNTLPFEKLLLLGTIRRYVEKLQPGEAVGPFYFSFGLGENPPGKQNWHPYCKSSALGTYQLTHTVLIGVTGLADGDQMQRDQFTSEKVEFKIVEGEKSASRDQGSQDDAEPPVDEKASLADLARDFNAENNRLGRGLNQPALTEAEILEYINRAQWKPESPQLNEPEIAAFRAVSLTKAVPKTSYLQVYTEDRTNTLVIKHVWHVRLMLPAIGHDGFVGLTIRDTTVSEEKIDPKQIAWGQPDAEGLSLGIYLSPKKAEYAIGERVRLRLFVRNDGKKAVNTTWANSTHPMPEDFSVTDDSGAKIAVTIGHESWNLPWISGYLTGGLAAGDIHAFYVPYEISIGGDGSTNKLIGRVIDARPGQKLQLRVRADNGNLRERNLVEQETEPWSGIVSFAIAKANNKSNDDPEGAAGKSRSRQKTAGTFRGTVTDPDGKPIPGAHIFVVPWRSEPGTSGMARTETDSDGRFVFEAADMTYADPEGRPLRRQGLLVASASGFAADWCRTWGNDVGGFRTHWTPIEGAPIHLRLVKSDVPVRGRFLNPDGSPLAGARVRILEVMIPQSHDLDAHLERETKFGLENSTDYERTLHLVHLLPGMTAETLTDDDGRFKLEGIGRDRLVRLQISAPTVVDTELTVMVRETANVRTRLGAPSRPDDDRWIIYGSGLTLTLKPGRTITGKVVDRLTDQPISGMWVGPRQNAISHVTSKLYPWVTDDAGRFTISGLSPVFPQYEIAAIATPGLPYQSASILVNDQSEAVIECDRGIPFELKLVDQHNRPVDAEVSYTDIHPNPFVAKERDEYHWPVNRALKQDNGTYLGFALPGPGAILIRLPLGVRYLPARVDPKTFFAPGTTEPPQNKRPSAFGNLEELVISRGIYRRVYYRDDHIPQKDYAAIVLVNPSKESGPLQLSATVTIQR